MRFCLTDDIALTVGLLTSPIYTIIQMAGMILLAKNTGIGMNNLDDMGIISSQTETMVFPSFDKRSCRIQTDNSILFHCQMITDHTANVSTQRMTNASDLLSNGPIMC